MIALITDGDIDAFRDMFGTMRNRRLANRLGLSGKGSHEIANAISSYAWNRIALRYCQDPVSTSIYLDCVAIAADKILSSQHYHYLGIRLGIKGKRLKRQQL